MIDSLQLMPGLLLCEPLEEEGVTAEGLWADHDRGEFFGYAFARVERTAPDVRFIKPGDFITFTRHAHLDVELENSAWLIINQEDVLAIIETDAEQDCVDGSGA